MTLQWQRNQNGTHIAEHGGRRYTVRRTPGIREWVLSIDGMFHSHRPTKDAAMARAEERVAREMAKAER